MFNYTFDTPTDLVSTATREIMAEVKTSTKTTTGVVPLRLSAIRGVQTTTAAGRVKGPGSTEVTKAAPIKSRTMREVVGSVRVETTQTSLKGVGVNRIRGSPAIDSTRLTTGLATNAKRTLLFPAQPKGGSKKTPVTLLMPFFC